MTSRNWIDWLVAAGGIVGGFASLLAVLLAVRGLDHSKQLTRAATLERRREHLARRLERLQGVANTLIRLSTFLETGSFAAASAAWRHLTLQLRAGRLRDELPEARRLVDGAIIFAEFGRLAIDVIETVLPEILGKIDATAEELAAVPDPTE